LPQPDNFLFAELVATIARLRAPDGCPWDREQSHLSMRENLLEECYEVLEAIDAADSRRLCVELGDLLMQVVFHSQIAAEAGDFTLDDVLRGINEKLIRRHPHVFADTEVSCSDEVVLNWETIKKEERAGDGSILSGVPTKMPSLSVSQEVQGRVARLGFDWKDDEGVLDKLCEEAAEIGRASSDTDKEEEYGDFLFTLCNLARRQKIDLESALRQANGKFRRRFAKMEELCQERGQTFEKLSFEEQNGLWEEVKKAVL
jgi:tetrapyrrole methylase family protein/MazG family protein